MSKSLVEIREDMEQRELHAKLAHVQEQFEGDDLALDLFVSATEELEKQAAEGAFGDAGISPSQLVSMSYEYSLRALEDLAKEASDEEAAEEASEEAVDEAVEAEMSEEEMAEEQEKEAQYYGVGTELGNLLGALDVTVEDLDKLAEFGSEEEQVAFGEFLSELAIEHFSEE